MKLSERINKNREHFKQNQAKLENPMNWPVGKTTFTILPLHSDSEYFEKPYGIHYIKEFTVGADGKQKMLGACGDKTTTYGDPDPVRETLTKLQYNAASAGRVQMAEHWQKALAKQYHIANAVILKKDASGKVTQEVKLIKFTNTQLDNFNAILQEYIEADETALLRWENRLVFTVERTGTNMNDTKYTFMPSPKSITLDPSIMDKATNIEDWVEAQFIDQGKVLNILAAIDPSVVQPQISTNVEKYLTCSTTEYDEDEFVPNAPVKASVSVSSDVVSEVPFDVDDDIPDFDNKPVAATELDAQDFINEL